MNVNLDQITAFVISALSDALEDYGPEYSATEASQIYGHESPLDSNDLVSMVIDLEARVEEELGFRISLTDERAVSQESSPFQDVPNMAKYILSVCEEKNTA